MKQVLFANLCFLNALSICAQIAPADSQPTDHWSGFTIQDVYQGDPELRAVVTSLGAILRVPIDREGRELSDQASLRLVPLGHERKIASGNDQLPEIWSQAIPVQDNTVAVVDTSTDASSWRGWDNWRGRGWRAPYHYYRHYRPWYNYYGRSHGYYGNYYHYYPRHYTTPSPLRDYYGNRYYYYPRYW